MNCPKCNEPLSEGVEVMESKVFELGPEYRVPSHVGKYYTEHLYVCPQCGYRHVDWYYTDSISNKGAQPEPKGSPVH